MQRLVVIIADGGGLIKMMMMMMMMQFPLKLLCLWLKKTERILSRDFWDDAPGADDIPVLTGGRPRDSRQVLKAFLMPEFPRADVISSVRPVFDKMFTRMRAAIIDHYNDDGFSRAELSIAMRWSLACMKRAGVDLYRVLISYLAIHDWEMLVELIDPVIYGNPPVLSLSTKDGDSLSTKDAAQHRLPVIPEFTTPRSSMNVFAQSARDCTDTGTILANLLRTVIDKNATVEGIYVPLGFYREMVVNRIGWTLVRSMPDSVFYPVLSTGDRHVFQPIEIELCITAVCDP